MQTAACFDLTDTAAPVTRKFKWTPGADQEVGAPDGRNDLGRGGTRPYPAAANLCSMIERGGFKGGVKPTRESAHL